MIMPEKNIYISFHGGKGEINSVFQYDLNGKLVDPSFFPPPSSGIATRELRGIITIDNLFYIANSYKDNSKILQYDPCVPVAISIYAGLAHPYGIAYDHVDKLIYVSNQDNNSISVYTLDRRYLHSISVPGSPRGIAFDDITKHLYVAVDNDHAVYIYNSSGVQLPHQLAVTNPIGVFIADSSTCSSDRLIYVSSNDNSQPKVCVFDQSLIQVDQYTTPEHPAGLFVDSEYLYVLVQNDRQLLRFHLVTKEMTVLIPSLPDIPEQIWIH